MVDSSDVTPKVARRIRPAPELDMVSAPQLGAQVIDRLDRGDRHLVLDFADVRLIDSAGIGVLLSCQRRVSAAGGQMVVVNASEHVQRVFEVTGVARALTLSSA